MADERFHLMIDVAALPAPIPLAADGSIYLGTIPAGSTIGQFDAVLGGWPVAHPERPPLLITPFGIARLIDGVWTAQLDTFSGGSTVTVASDH